MSGSSILDERTSFSEMNTVEAVGRWWCEFPASKVEFDAKFCSWNGFMTQNPLLAVNSTEMTNILLTKNNISIFNSICHFQRSWGFWLYFLLFIVICMIIWELKHTRSCLSLHTPPCHSSADRSRTRTQEPYTGGDQEQGQISAMHINPKSLLLYRKSSVTSLSCS